MQSQNDGVSSSDSEGSSNLQTAIHSASLTGQRWSSPHPSVQTQSCGAAVERWVESTTKEPSVRLQGEKIPLRKEVLFISSHWVNTEMMNASPPLTQQDLNTLRLPSSITTFLNPHSAPPWIQKREAAHCTPALVIGQYMLSSQWLTAALLKTETGTLSSFTNVDKDLIIFF